jgi:hypothetical protein
VVVAMSEVTWCHDTTAYPTATADPMHSVTYSDYSLKYLV